MFPDVDNQHFAGCQRKQGTLPLKVLVFASLTAVGAFYVHDEDVLGHGGAIGGLLVFAHPYALCGLPALLLGHDAKLGPEEVVEQRGLARGLRSEDGDEVVVEAGWDDLLDIEIGGQVVAA